VYTYNHTDSLQASDLDRGSARQKAHLEEVSERALIPATHHNIEGLSESEVIARRQQGQGNDVRFLASRSYIEILQKNAFTFINTVLFAIGIVLILLGNIGDALATAGLVLLNVAVGVFQEGRAKHKLEQIALLTRPKATVVRGGQEKAVDPSEIVLGDVLVVRPGDQIVVDGQVIGAGQIEVDESLLTGESENVRKQGDDSVYSGSFCVSGSALYEAQKVGADCLVNQITAGARAFRQIKTPLQRDVDFIIRLLVVLATQLGVLLAISFAMRDIPMVESVRAAAVIVALVPQGLFFMTTVAYAMGVVRVAGKGALIQEANAIESISNVNLLCLDKTGTLTTNRIRLHAMYPVAEAWGGDEAELRRILGDYAASTPGANRTIVAVKEAFDGQPRRVEEEAPFSSERKWSALAFDDPTLRGMYFLGAPEVLYPYLQFDPDLGSRIDEWADDGLRVLLFACRPDNASLRDAGGEPQLPSGLIPLSLLSFSDELRPEAQETVSHFAELGIQLKIISGDNPHTVAALSRQVGLTDDLQVVSGLDLDTMDDSQLEELAEEATIFGRIAPQQKEKLVRLFRSKGHYVAMIGDGVNDVLSLKRAHVGVAMQSGSQATRSVADIVLLGDSFAALPIAFREGQRIIKGMEDVVRLLLTRTFYVMLLIIAAQFVGVPFPVTPRHNFILALLTVGIPIFALAAWARPGMPPRSVIRSASHFVFSAALTISVVSLAVYLYYLGTTGDVEIARTALTTATVLCGLVLIPFVEPPTEAWVGGDALSGDWRPTALALGMLGLYGAIMAVPSLRASFELVPLHWLDYLLIGIVVAVWALLLRFIWRARLFERLLELR
jgi:cation-transporting ATPase E